PRSRVFAETHDARERVIERRRDLVQEALSLPPLGVRRIYLDDERDAFVHRDGKRLRAAHPAKAGAHHQATGERPRKMPLRDRGEGLVRALQYPLGPDVDPGARGHLAVHREAKSLEPSELVPGRPARDDQCVGDEHARCPLVRAKDPDRLSRLHEEGLVVFQPLQGRQDESERMERSFVMPAHNEESTVAGVVAGHRDTARALASSFEIIFCDDGSTDATWAALEASRAATSELRLMRNPSRSGIPFSMKRL